VPLEKLDSDLSLERAHPLAHGSWCDPKLGRGTRKIAVPGAGRQNAQRFQRR
jgi:hypothetical protein